MKRTLCLILMTALALCVATSAFAKPDVTEFRNKDFNMESIKTVLVLPVFYDVQLPQSEAFLTEAVQQKWNDMTKGRQDKLPYLVKTPKEVVERDAYVKGAPAVPMSPQQAAEKALVLASEYVDGILMCTVTKAGTAEVQHPGEYVTRYRYEDVPVWRNDRWEKDRISIPYQEYKAPWTESFTQGGVKIELRSAKDNTLVYGNSVVASTGEGLFTDAPPLSKHIQNVVENAAKRLPVK